ncbi:MAG: hypothetical protein ACE5OR_17245, partial [bacterium]
VGSNSMLFQKYIVSLISLSLPFALTLSAREDFKQTSLSLHRKEALLLGDGTPGPYRLPDYFILIETERVELEGNLLTRDLNYVIDYDSGELTFNAAVPEGLSIRITYERLPIGLKRTYLHRRLLQSEGQSGSAAVVQEEPPTKRPDLRDMTSLRIGGSKSFGISLGSNRDLSLEQSLRVNITGRVARDIEVTGLLSDQSSPLQPEGTTQRLEELDKVSVDIRGKNVRATFGDYVLSLKEMEFGRFNRKLQGAMGQLILPSGEVTVSGASSKGTFTTNRFLGMEGNQGPYQLRAEDGSVDIIVLAGTERVWIDGEPMTRGENNDYTIEYANGQITFTRHRLITGESRIVVDFEYVDEQYRRSLYAGRGSVSLGGDKLRLGAMIFQEADDRSDPLGVALSEADRGALAAAGDDPDQAFRYAEDGSTKVYLPLPRSHSLADFDLRLSTVGVEVLGEVGLSRYDANTFSKLDDSDNIGGAYKITGRLKPRRVTVGGLNVGDFELTGLYRTYGDRFQPVGRTVIAEYDRRWDLPSEMSRGTENVRELNGVYRPHRESVIGFGIGGIDLGDTFTATRREIRSDFTVRGFPQVHYVMEMIASRESSPSDSVGSQKGRWTRHNLRGEYTFWRLKPTVKLEGERKEQIHSGRTAGGFKFYEIE